jgi:anti-sigma factor RsiW
MGKAESHDVRLQRYFDGELTPEERAEVEAALTDDDRLKLAALGEVRGLVANALSAEAAEIDLWPALEKQLAARQGGGVAGGKAETKARRRWGMRAHPASWSAGLGSLAAAAALLFFLQPWHSAHAQNGCEIESLETYGAVATVINMDDAPHRGDEATTVIWTTEDD